MSAQSAPPPETLVNGVESSTLAVADRGLHYGDGLFETITCMRGRPRWLELHLGRMARGCARLGIDCPPEALLRHEIERLAAVPERCIVKLIVTRGLAIARGYRPTGNERSTRIVTRHQWPALAAGPFHVGISPVRLGENSALAGLKHLNRLEQVLAQQQSAAANLAEVLMLSTSDQVICGSMSNVFALGETGLLTPDLTHCGVAGVMRELVLQAAESLGMAARVAALTMAELARVPSLFVTNVRIGVQPVASVAGRTLHADPRVQRLTDWIHDAAS